MEPNSEAEKLHSLPKNLYMEYIKLFPVTRVEEVKSYTTILLTLSAIILFSVFAIQPTIETILELRKTLEDSRFTQESLEKKEAALASLQQEYTTFSINNDLKVLDNAIPTTPQAPMLLGKVQTLAKIAELRVVNIETSSVELTKQGGKSKVPSSFVFTIVVAGTYDETIRFIESLTTFDRLITIDEVAITTETQSPDPLSTSIRARAYFHPEVL